MPLSAMFRLSDQLMNDVLALDDDQEARAVVRQLRSTLYELELVYGLRHNPDQLTLALG